MPLLLVVLVPPSTSPPRFALVVDVPLILRAFSSSCKGLVLRCHGHDRVNFLSILSTTYVFSILIIIDTKIKTKKIFSLVAGAA